MTGWRMGYACAPKPVAKQMLKIHQYCIMCAPTTAQYAAVEALRNGDSDIEMMVAEYDRRRRYVYNGLKEIGIDAFMPEGAFYIYPDIRKFGLSSGFYMKSAAPLFPAPLSVIAARALHAFHTHIR